MENHLANPVPLFPPNQPVYIWAVVLCCTVFWLGAYVLIIKRGFQDKSFGMPMAAFCGNIVWEVLFSRVFPPDWMLIRIGNYLWVLLDVGILVTIWKYGREDYQDPFVRRWFYWLLALGFALSASLQYPFVKVYNDRHGGFLGWAAAFMMSILFIAMLLRRNNLKGQSLYIALCMLLGNVGAFLWIKDFPDTPPRMNPDMNLAFALCTWFVNSAYVVLVYQKCRSQGLNPWTRV